MATSQNGYTVIDNREDCKVYTINADSGLKLALAPGVEGEVIALFMKRFDKFVEPLEKNQSWGYNKRAIAGSTDWSNHASGTAADGNSLKHPQGATNTFSDKQVASIRKIQDDFDDVVKWGGDYRNTKDEMHFETNAERDAVSLVVRRLKRYNKVYRDRLYPGKRNLDVYMVKRALRREGYDAGTMNLYFGVAMTRAIEKYQADNGLRVNGDTNKNTLEHLGLRPQ